MQFNEALLIVESRPTHNILTTEDEVLRDAAAKAFNDLAEAQRGRPERAMLKAHDVYGGGGGQNPLVFNGGYEWVSEKVKRVYNALFTPSGWMTLEQEFDNGLHSPWW